MIKLPNPVKRTRRLITELIGRTSTVYRRIIQNYNAPRRDITQTDYPFWDRARRGKAVGMYISGLLLQPVTNKIASWVIGKPPTVKAESPETTDALNKWMYTAHPDLLSAYRGSLDLGDNYLVINPDLSLTIIPPNVIQRIVDQNDYSILLGYRIIERHPHPTLPGQWQTIEDIYTATERIRTIINQSGSPISKNTFPNLLGRIPIVHIPNNRSEGEYFGRPQLEATVVLLQQYGEVLDSAIFGNIRQGRPTPVINFKDEEALDAFWGENAETVTRKLPDGSTETYEKVNWSADEIVLAVGQMGYAQPGSFTGDTKTLLTVLYFIFLEHAEVPEFVMGTAITGSKASAETQMPIFERFIWGKRTEARAWLIETLNIVQEYMVILRQIPIVEKTVLIWDALTGQDTKLTQETIEWALKEGLIDDATALQQSSLELDEIEEIINKAREERAEKDTKQRAEDFQVLFQRAQADEEEAERQRVAANGN